MKTIAIFVLAMLCGVALAKKEHKSYHDDSLKERQELVKEIADEYLTQLDQSNGEEQTAGDDEESITDIDDDDDNDDGDDNNEQDEDLNEEQALQLNEDQDEDETNRPKRAWFRRALRRVRIRLRRIRLPRIRLPRIRLPRLRLRLRRFLGRISIRCTTSCFKYHKCRVESLTLGRCTSPSGCDCNKFAWEGKK